MTRSLLPAGGSTTPCTRWPTRCRCGMAVLDGTGLKDRTMLSAAGGSVAGVGITPLFTRCWPAICKVAARLFSHCEVGHDDVTKAVGLSVDPDTAAIELAHIRAGFAPGSFTVSRRAPA